MERLTWLFLAAACCLTMVAALTNSSLTTDESALLALKARITSDPGNIISTNWSTTTPICNWVGITCGARHFRVSVLNLSYMGLTSTIPPELGNLSFLVELSLRNNSFHGAMPLELGRLHRLKLISFRFNNFMGAIPSWFGSLSKLETFDLYGNQFSGSIPAAIFNLTALQVISLSNNQLSGSIPREIGNLTKLKEIYLDNNNFREIPNEIGILNQLEKLFVQFNDLQGHVPLAVFNMSSLITLTFYRNSLNGSLPKNIYQHLPSIQQLDLAYNQIDGPIPSNIGNLTQIRMIDLGWNYLTGTIPHEIGHLPSLDRLALGINNLDGLIPSSIFNISTITLMDLHDNQLSGTLPANVGLGLPNLIFLFIGGNTLRGVFSKSISNASQLVRLELGSNLFSGFIPSELCALTNLRRLTLHQNNFTIDTSSPGVNFFSCLASLKDLSTLALSDNPLNSKLSVSFSNLSASVEFIYLADCNMRGNIPNHVGNLTNLTLLDLAENELSGPIPTSLGRLPNVQLLDVHGNKLQGHIPDELCQLNHLNELSLYENQLTGAIPACLGNLNAALRGLFLQSNLLTSTIPSTLWGLTDIFRLNLSSNSLVGPLTEGFGNLKVVTDVDLSNNQLSGSIPSSIESLQNLVNLSLASNNLEGLIPSSFGNMLSLERLDLSQNNLSGMIPKSLEALSYLKYLNLSFNKLQGEIPTGGPFTNLSAQSFVSNRGLCGVYRFHVQPCRKKSGTSILRYVIPGILSAMFLLISIIWLMLRKNKNVEATIETSYWPQPLYRRVSYHELLTATNGFSVSNLLGIGSFGSVYRGTFSDGVDVAIKVLNLETEGAFTSFDVECEMLSNIRHRNLIRIISCCSQNDFKALILNYMPNGSLEKWLYSHNCSLNLLKRLDIMIDVASALEYLHHDYETPIVHCDLKPNNILLDDDMVAHVADFGIAKLLGTGDSMTQTMTLATIGYMAPEYGREGIVTRRGDVYSFGIVLMETFTRRKPTDEMFVGEMSLKQWVANSLFADAIAKVVDTNLLGTQEDNDTVRKECLASIMRLALSCSAESSEERLNMQEALATLQKIKVKFLKDREGNVLLNRPLIHKSFN
ncbi:PREDICTED: putative receptor-like protein kinase At3g47110-like [Fragaria vesca subsp. vesca]